MEIRHPATAGVPEASDAQICVQPGKDGIHISLESTVANQYGRQICALILKTLKRMNISSVEVEVSDKGALDCILQARLECALLRATDSSFQNIAWGKEIIS